MDPRGMIGRIYKEEHYTLLQTKYESSGPCGFGDFFMFNRNTIYCYKQNIFLCLTGTLYIATNKI